MPCPAHTRPHAVMCTLALAGRSRHAGRTPHYNGRVLGGQRDTRELGGVSTWTIDENNTLEIKSIGVAIATVETRPSFDFSQRRGRGPSGCLQTCYLVWSKYSNVVCHTCFRSSSWSYKNSVDLLAQPQKAKMPRNPNTSKTIKNPISKSAPCARRRRAAPAAPSPSPRHTGPWQ